MALYFNARDPESWAYLKCIENISECLKFIGGFPMIYSATSVVQDNRQGAMKSDYIIIYQKQQANGEYPLSSAFTNLPNWSAQFPQPVINSYLDNFADKNLSDLKISFKYKGKPQTFTALTDVIFVVK
jgi:hypothetical protein